MDILNFISWLKDNPNRFLNTSQIPPNALLVAAIPDATRKDGNDIMNYL